MADCWDPQKNRINQRVHRIRFEDAQAVFDDPLALYEYDDREYGEDRWKVIGNVSGTIMLVVFTERACGEWLISARKADPDEEWRYFTRSFGA